ncbi:hypothetical protein [Desulfosoma caldarium]|uniref:hypothetical protein n=1 Tax=Desulfosoma caldarium TaxID=610254 RepID=UPI000F466B19|nr:hypothetical protein [Desulfosoma caldarium]
MALAGLVLVISGPSTIIAWLKLRQRNLELILDACGRAANARAKPNTPFGKTPTGMPRLPEGAQRTMEDPHAEKTKPWKLGLLLAALPAAAVIV